MLTELNIPEGIKVIEDETFHNNFITTLDIPGGIKIIGEDAFSYNPLEKLTLHEGLVEIGKRAFVGKPPFLMLSNGAIEGKLIGIVIPSSVKKIGALAFDGNPLVSITIGKDVDLSVTGISRKDEEEIHEAELMEQFKSAGFVIEIDAPATPSFYKCYADNGKKAGTWICVLISLSKKYLARTTPC